MRKPPRPLCPGDIVVGHSGHLGEWTAAQVTALDERQRLAAVLELTWSGPEPDSLADLGELVPLRLGHHSWQGEPQHCWHTWVLPKGHRVLGNVPPLVTEPSRSYSGMWTLGLRLDGQRQWDAGNRGERVSRVPSARYAAPELPTARDEALRELSLTVPAELDCAVLAELLPGLTSLTVHGELATLVNAGALGRLTGLRTLCLYDVFGMTGADVPSPADLPHLAWLTVDGVPAEYASALRKLWKPEDVNGTYLSVRGARSPDWVAENRDNPLRSWDGNVKPVAYRKAFAQYKTTRRAVQEALAAGAGPERLTELGAEFAEAFNGMDARWNFVETVEREDLLEAVHAMTDLDWARQALAEGLDSARDW
ncbi:hypothetical protein JOF53_007121 [Crossiella equi]|uniref:RNA ligase n=1 Tax=Crossiella equi TaxID=130796 RepID=A0ABS5ANT1_9PSEU|nr:hypothetical protein [Crossiella equi]MBP2478249.1 hypothetical protein [Crossiella equi]